MLLAKGTRKNFYVWIYFTQLFPSFPHVGSCSEIGLWQWLHVMLGIPMRLTIRQCNVFSLPKKGVENEGVLLNPSNVCAPCSLETFQSHQAYYICYPVSAGKICYGNILLVRKNPSLITNIMSLQVRNVGKSTRLTYFCRLVWNC